MTALLDAVEEQLGGDWIDAVEWLRDQNQLDDVENRLRAGDVDGAVVGVEAAALRFAANVAEVYTTAGQQTAAWLDALVPDKLVSFDTTNYRAVAWAQRNRLDLVNGLTNEQRELIRDVIAEGIRAGQNPRVTARDIRAAIGLTPIQEDHVTSYRLALESGDYANALSRELADGRSDRSLQVAMRDGSSLPEAQIDSMVERYRANYVAFRAETIARTEGLRAIHEGSEEALQQAVSNGDVQVAQLVRTWHSAHDKRVRAWHAVMDGQEAALGETFESGDGNELKYPGDPDAPASEVVSCRCVVSTRFVG